MGIEGIAVAAGVVLLVAIVAPALYRGRAVIAEAPADERFAPDLRMISERRYAQESHSEYRCTIYSSERIMDTKVRSSQSHTALQRDSRVRTLARARSHAKARMAARRALRTRFGFGGALISAVVITLWVLVRSIHLNLAAPIIASLILAGYVAGFVYLSRIWSAGDADDAAIIADAEAELKTLRPQRRAAGRASAARRNGKAHRAAEHETVLAGEPQSSQIAAEIHDGQPAPRDAEKTSAIHDTAVRSHSPHTMNEAESAPQPYDADVQNSRVNDAPVRTNLESTDSDRQAHPKRKIIVPTYTIKPSESYAAAHTMRGKGFSAERASVTPYTPEQMPEAPVPYRPKQLGERIANEAPEMMQIEQSEVEDKTAQAAPANETRHDVLGGGATLDSLLERRRA